MKVILFQTPANRLSSASLAPLSDRFVIHLRRTHRNHMRAHAPHYVCRRDCPSTDIAVGLFKRVQSLQCIHGSQNSFVPQRSMSVLSPAQSGAQHDRKHHFNRTIFRDCVNLPAVIRYTYIPVDTCAPLLSRPSHLTSVVPRVV